MRVIKSIETTDAILTSSNILENEHSQWVSGTSYAVAARVIYNHKIYERIVAGGGTVTPDLDKTNWLYVSYTNKYSMFDNIISNKSSRTGNIQFTLRPDEVVDSIIFLNVAASAIRVVMTDPVTGIIYNEERVLYGLGGVNDFYGYFFAATGDAKTSAVFLNLPENPTATISVTIDAGSAEASVGEVVYGKQTVIGRTNYGTQIGIKSYSRKEVDEFGNITVVKRKNSKFAEYDLDIDNYRLADVQRFFAEIDSVPCVFIGNESMDELIVFGFYSEFKATISFPTVSKCNLRVEGLI